MFKKYFNLAKTAFNEGGKFVTFFILPLSLAVSLTGTFMLFIFSNILISSNILPSELLYFLLGVFSLLMVFSISTFTLFVFREDMEY